MKILIVDDEPLIRKGLTKIIHRFDAGFKVIGEAASGKNALELIAQLTPDLVITDIKMPEMDGVELVKQLELQFPQVKKAVLSGFDEFQLVRETLKNGALDYLLKPVDEAELRQLLNAVQRTLGSTLESTPSQAAIVPDDPNAKKENRLIEAVKDYLSHHYPEPLTLTTVAEFFRINPNYLCERFKQHTGEHFVSFLTRLRIEQAKRLLSDVTVKAYEVSYRVGYEDPTYFSKVFKKRVGVTPTEYRQKRR